LVAGKVGVASVETGSTVEKEKAIGVGSFVMKKTSWRVGKRARRSFFSEGARKQMI
jgi:hypothetical protein